jgi:hypothetical protein
MSNLILEESVMTSMDGVNIDIVKYLPYILQDFWEIGTSQEKIISMVLLIKERFLFLYLPQTKRGVKK